MCGTPSVGSSTVPNSDWFPGTSFSQILNCLCSALKEVLPQFDIPCFVDTHRRPGLSEQKHSCNGLGIGEGDGGRAGRIGKRGNCSWDVK